MEDISCSITDVDDVTKDLEVSIAEGRVTQEFDSVIKDTARKAHLKGFRPGKAPRSVIMKLMGDRVRVDVANRLLGNALPALYEEHKLEVIGEPQITLDSLEPTGPVNFKARVFLMPKPLISNYKNREVEVTKKTVTDEVVEEAIQKLRDAKAELKVPEGRTALQMGDVAALSLSLNEANEEPGRPEPFVDEIGAGKLPRAVEEELVGLEIGGIKVVTTVVPEDFSQEELRGKEVTFTCKLESIFNKLLPELDDEFAKKALPGAESVEDLRTKTKERIEKESADELKSDAQGAVLDVLVEEHQFPVPQALVDHEIRAMLYRFGAIRGDPQAFDISPFRERLSDVALKRARCSVIVDRIAQQEEVTVNDEDKERMIDDIAQRSGSTREATQRMLGGRDNDSSFLEEVKRSKVVDLLVQWSKVTYKEAS